MVGNILTNASIKAAEIIWDEHNQPYSSLFKDHYYSQFDGLGETEHVYIQGNNLLNRWSDSSYKKSSFCIMETGFGSGLNFLTAWKLWKTMPMSISSKLHYLSVEKYPMTSLQLEKAMNNWKDAFPIELARLLNSYPSLDIASHQLNFEEDNLSLTLYFSDIREQIPRLSLAENKQVDAWFLDGFSPAKNPQMWQQDLYPQMYRLSNKRATVATYTVAGKVRRGLEAAGFEIHRKPGFGNKRDMLTAIKT